MYKRSGYVVMYSIGIGSMVLSLIIILFLNTGRGRRAQAGYDEELEKQAMIQERLIKPENESDDDEKLLASSLGTINNFGDGDK